MYYTLPHFLVCWQPVVISKMSVVTSKKSADNQLYIFQYQCVYVCMFIEVFIQKIHLCILWNGINSDFVTCTSCFFYSQFRLCDAKFLFQRVPGCNGIADLSWKIVSGLVSLQLGPLIWETVSPRTLKPKLVNKVSIIQCLVIIG